MAKVIAFSQVASECDGSLPLSSLFKASPYVVVGDSLSSFYLQGKAAMPVGATQPYVKKVGNLFYVNFKIPRPSFQAIAAARDAIVRTQCAYFELVYEAGQAGCETIVLDLPVEMQEGIDRATSLYKAKLDLAPLEVIQAGLLRATIAKPMDAVLLQAAAMNIKVVAVSATPYNKTGLAAFFRESENVHKIPTHLTGDDRADYYYKHFFAKDVANLESEMSGVFSRKWKQAARSFMRVMLTNTKEDLRQALFDEYATLTCIRKATQGKPFLGLFHASHLFAAKDGLLPGLYNLFGPARLKTAQMVGCDRLYPQRPAFKIAEKDGGFYLIHTSV